MADGTFPPYQTIPDLTPATALNFTDQVWINQAGADLRCNIGDLAALAPVGVTSFNGRNGPVTLNISDITTAGGAPNISPFFGGTPQAPTPPIGAADNRIATTAFVFNEVASGVAGVGSFNGRIGLVTLLASDVDAAGGPYLTVASGPYVTEASGPYLTVASGPYLTVASGPYLPLAGGIVAGALTVESDATFEGDVTFDGVTTLNGTVMGPVNVTGDVSVTGDISSTGDASVGGNMSVSGSATYGGAATFLGDASFHGTVNTVGFSVGSLPPPGVIGRRAFVIDARDVSFNVPVIGGGSIVCPVFDNGVDWVAA